MTLIARSFCALLGAGFSVACLAAVPLTDRLDRPSQSSVMATRSPLTAVQPVAGRLVMVGESGHVLVRQADGSVQQAQVPVDLLLTAVHFPDAQHGWVVGHDGVVLHSDDGGSTWRKQLEGKTIAALMLTAAQEQLEQAQAASDAAPTDQVLSTALDNASFAVDDAQAGVDQGGSRPLLDVWFRTASEGWAVGAYGMFVHTTDGGANWRYITTLNNPERLHLNAIVGLPSGELLVAGEGGRVYRSLDNGQHWSEATQLSKASLYKLLPLADGRVLALGFGGSLFSTADHGSSWKSLTVPTQASLYGGQQLADGSVLLVGQGGALLRSRDGVQFSVLPSPVKAPWMGVAEGADKQLVLIGSGGMQAVPMATLSGAAQ
jgi:photosystem II stability/assembly factor-like uncharacterized protein